MAKSKLNITCNKCGKNFVHEHFSHNRSEADQYEEWAKHNVTVCPNCYKLEKQEKEQKELESKLSGIVLADLSGSEKQVKWAKSIRENAVALLIGKIKEEALPGLLEAINSKTDAKWWIDNRDYCTIARNFVKLIIQ